MLSAQVEQARIAVRHVRRARGAARLRSLATTGGAPTAVRDAIRKAIAWPSDSDERELLLQIEAKRDQLLASVEPLAFPDLGAGHHTAPMVHRTLGEMTLSSKAQPWAYLLFRLIRELRPTTGIELGACVGISAAYQAAALHLNATGRLISLEGADVLADRSNLTLKELGLADHAEVRHGRFADILGPTLDAAAPVQWAFIDGHHDGGATLDYADQIIPRCDREAVLVFDDINWSVGMRQAWGALVHDPRFRLTVDLRTIGIAVLSADPSPRQRWSVPYW